METVFITIHDISLDARIKFCSDSVEYVLGYTPRDVRGKSCWEYFHPDEIPFAREVHGRGIDLEKAAVLNYCRIKHKDGSWVGCECVFTVVHDVLIGCTSVYTRGPKALRRAIDGANVRRIFASSPRDPRYHMLSYLSSKFYQEPKPHAREPRAALFLNRFTRTSTVMYATSGVQEILGVRPDQLQGKSFYFCIEEECLQESVKCLESAKSNDSIAYLRFRYRDPLQTLSRAHSVTMSDMEESDEDDDGGVSIGGSRSSGEMRDSATPQANGGTNFRAPDSSNSVPQTNGVNHSSDHSATMNGPDSANGQNGQLNATEDITRSSSGNSTDLGANSRDAVFDPPELQESNSSSRTDEEEPTEIEAVISCSSDGLVVVLRRAHPLVPAILGETQTPHYENGMFASPWAPDPVMPRQIEQTTVTPQVAFPSMAEPAEAGFMAAIRDVAVFAWSLTGINGSLTEYSRGVPSGDALPPGGLPVWDPNATKGLYEEYNGFSGSRHRPFSGMGDPSGVRGQETTDSTTSSDDEVIWKRAPTMAPWRRPTRRAHHDAFGEDGENDADGENSEGGRKKTWKSGGESSSS